MPTTHSENPLDNFLIRYNNSKRDAEDPEKILAPNPPEPVIEVSKPLTEAERQAKINKMLGGVSEEVSVEIREAVNEILNDRFQIHRFLDAMGYRFTLVIPPEYSPLERNEPDVRSRVTGGGIEAIKSFCSLVFTSFPEQVRMRIIRDREEQC